MLDTWHISLNSDNTPKIDLLFPFAVEEIETGKVSGFAYGNALCGWQARVV